MDRGAGGWEDVGWRYVTYVLNHFKDVVDKLLGERLADEYRVKFTCCNSRGEFAKVLQSLLKSLRKHVNEGDKRVKQRYHEFIARTEKFCEQIGVPVRECLFYSELIVKIELKLPEDLRIFIKKDLENLLKSIPVGLLVTVSNSRGGKVLRGLVDASHKAVLRGVFKKGEEYVVRVYPLKLINGKYEYLLDVYPELRKAGFTVEVGEENVRIGAKGGNEVEYLLGSIKVTVKVPVELREERLFMSFKKLLKRNKLYGKIANTLVEECFTLPSIKRVDVRFSDIVDPKKKMVAGVKVLFGDDHHLYSHQHKALKLLEEGKSVLLTSGYASGKTEVGVLYAFRRILEGSRKMRILVIYPTKPLTSDQVKRWKRYFEWAYDLGILGEKIHVLRYDRDVMKQRGLLRKQLGDMELDEVLKIHHVVILTNPAFLLTELLNGIEKSSLFKHGRFDLIVIDEVHYYSTWDLTLLMLLLGYLRRMGIADKFLFLSATVGEPEKLGKSIEEELGVEVEVVREEPGKERTRRRILYVIGPARSEIGEKITIDLCRECLRSREKTLVFVPNRNTAERIAGELRRRSKRERTRVEVHLGDMSPWEREYVERGFKKGDITMLVTVKTLEVGIDIGGVQRVIHLGTPATINDLVQREGRMGRHGEECESIIICLTPRDRKMAEEYIEYLKRGRGEEYLRRPVIHRGEFIKRIAKRMARTGRVPRSIKISNKRLEVSFYSQEKARFAVRAREGEDLREVRKPDVLYRYLPASIRRIRWKNYIVSDVRAGEKVVLLKELDRGLMGKDLPEDLSWFFGEKRKLLSLIREGRVFTTSHIDVLIESESLDKYVGGRGYGLRVLEVREMPLGTNFIEKRLKRIRVKGEDVLIPVFVKVGYYRLNERLRRELTVRTLTRGITLSFDPSELVGRLELSHLRDFGLPEEELLDAAYMMLFEHFHAALHLLVNTIARLHGWREDEIEHYVRIRPVEARRFLNAILKMLNASAPPLRMPEAVIEVALANVDDLLEKVRWNKVLKELRRLKERLKSCNSLEEGIALCEEVLSACYAWRCYASPMTLQALMDSVREEGAENLVKRALAQALSIVSTAIYVGERVRGKLYGVPEGKGG